MAADTSGRSETFSFSSHDNPHISAKALTEITKDMTHLAYRQEILAEDVEDVLGALWKHSTIDVCRVQDYPDLSRVVVGVDPPGGVTECGIVVAGSALCSCRGKAELHAFVLEDSSIYAPPDVWAAAWFRRIDVIKPIACWAKPILVETWWNPPFGPRIERFATQGFRPPAVRRFVPNRF